MASMLMMAHRPIIMSLLGEIEVRGRLGGRSGGGTMVKERSRVGVNKTSGE